MKKLSVAADIRKAQTLPGEFYCSPDYFNAVKERILSHTWHYITDTSLIREPGDVYPHTLLKGVLDEPLLFTVDDTAKRHCLSNVCTHRGKVLVEEAGKRRQLTCGYHGRCFDLNGRFQRMPAFKNVENFPSPADHLTKVPFAAWDPLLFASPDPAIPLEEMIAPIRERTDFLPLDQYQYVPDASDTFKVKANWALYCDNYLEGFHIPFVHPALNQALDFGQYDYEIFPYCNLQIGIADENEPIFDLPPGHPDYGRRVYAYYFFLFPNLMFNFYPWGLSLNSIEPLGIDETLVRFRMYQLPGTPFEQEQKQLEATELEDEQIVESCQLGIQSRFYKSGRFSPEMEPCVHHFHRLIARFLNGGEQ